MILVRAIDNLTIIRDREITIGYTIHIEFIYKLMHSYVCKFTQAYE